MTQTAQDAGGGKVRLALYAVVIIGAYVWAVRLVLAMMLLWR